MQQERSIRTVAEAIALADEWAAYARLLETAAERQAAENERLRIFLRAADKVAE